MFWRLFIKRFTAMLLATALFVQPAAAASTRIPPRAMVPNVSTTLFASQAVTAWIEFTHFVLTYRHRSNAVQSSIQNMKEQARVVAWRPIVWMPLASATTLVFLILFYPSGLMWWALAHVVAFQSFRLPRENYPSLNNLPMKLLWDPLDNDHRQLAIGISEAANNQDKLRAVFESIKDRRVPPITVILMVQAAILALGHTESKIEVAARRFLVSLALGRGELRLELAGYTPFNFLPWLLASLAAIGIKESVRIQKSRSATFESIFGPDAARVDDRTRQFHARRVMTTILNEVLKNESKRETIKFLVPTSVRNNDLNVAHVADEIIARVTNPSPAPKPKPTSPNTSSNLGDRLNSRYNPSYPRSRFSSPGPDNPDRRRKGFGVVPVMLSLTILTGILWGLFTAFSSYPVVIRSFSGQPIKAIIITLLLGLFAVGAAVVKNVKKLPFADSLSSDRSSLMFDRAA